MQQYSSRLIITVILMGFVILAALYSRAIPIFEASDEAEHFIYIHTILETGKLPVIQSRDDMARQSDPVLRWNNQSHHAPLYYLLGAGLIAWSERADLADYVRPNELIFLRDTVEDNPNKWLHSYSEPTGDTHDAVYVLRAFNILVGCATLFMIYLTAKAAFDSEYVALASMLMTASIPTFIAVNVSVTNDALVILLYSAGLFWTINTWKKRDLSWRNGLLISVILAGIALTKLTGISLFGVVYFALGLGIWRKRWSLRDGARVILTTLIVTSLLAGWWYVRNYQLYGDPFALVATASIWGRSTPLTLPVFFDEVIRIGKTFWMMIGYLHQPVLAPEWFYRYAAGATLIAGVGFIWSLRSRRQATDAILTLAILIVTAMLLYGTRSVDISYGRLLFPALAAFAPMFVMGWKRLLGKFSVLTILPITALTILAPVQIIPMAYQPLEVIDTIPETATLINWSADGLEIIAVDVPDTPVHPGEELRIHVYFRGNHPLNPALLVTAIDSIAVERLDHVEIFPGMAATDTLSDKPIYHIPLTLQLGNVEAVRAPRLIMINLEWQDAGDEAEILFDNGKNILEINGPTLVDSRYQVSGRALPVDAHFGEAIGLDYYCLSNSGESIHFVWNPLQPMNNDWTLTIQLFDASGNLVSQADGSLWWYPTSAWVVETRFRDSRTFALPDDFASEKYEIRVGWYRQEGDNFTRMAVTQGASVDNLLVLPPSLSACD